MFWRVSIKLYILRFHTKLLVKLRFPNFRIILRLYSPLTICASQKQQQKKKKRKEKKKKSSQSLEEILYQVKLLLLSKIHVNAFEKIISSAIFVIVAIIFKVIFSFPNVFTSKTHQNCHRSLKCVLHCLNLSISRVFIKISYKIVSSVALWRFSNILRLC